MNILRLIFQIGKVREAQDNMVNKRLLEMAERQKDKNFLKKEEEKAERIRELEVEEQRKRKEELDYIDSLDVHRGNELEKAVYTFVNHSEFPIIYNQANTLETATDKWGFILRRAYEIGQEVNVTIGHEFQTQDVQAKKALEDYGIYLLCQYFEQDEKQITGESCLIEGNPIASTCQGKYDICSILESKAKKAAVGDIQFPEVKRKSPKIKIPKLDVNPVDVGDLNDWWRGEGDYE